MRRLWAVVLIGLSAAAGGCGTQDILLGTEGDYLFTVTDTMANPGEEISLKVRLQSGDFLRGRQGHVVRFTLDGTPYKAAETNGDGVATVSFEPPAAGNYRFTAEVAPMGLAKAPPPPQQLLVTCREREDPLVVVDLDKTVVASGFHTVLIGDPTPMAGSVDVLKRLTGQYTIVYLTHRPDALGPKSKRWLRQQGYPAGPVLLSDIGGFFSGSGTYKSEALARLKRRFEKIEIGIGDKISDAQAYHANGLKAFLIIQVPDTATAAALTTLADALAPLPDDVQVVTGWDQVAKAIFGEASYPRSAAQRRLKALAETRSKTRNAESG